MRRVGAAVFLVGAIVFGLFFLEAFVFDLTDPSRWAYMVLWVVGCTACVVAFRSLRAHAATGR